MPSGLPRATINPISRVTKLITRCSRGSSHSRQALMPCARRSPRGTSQARQVARALRQRDQRILVADVAQIDPDAGLAVEEFAQFGNGKAMAGMDADDRRTLLQERLDLAGKLLREVFELRAEPGLHALAGPYQPLAEGGQPRALAALGFYQRRAEKCRPLFDQIPDVPVRQVRIARRAGDLSGFADLVQHAQHHDDAVQAAFLAEAPGRLDLDVQHISPIYEVGFT